MKNATQKLIKVETTHYKSSANYRTDCGRVSVDLRRVTRSHTMQRPNGTPYRSSHTTRFYSVQAWGADTFSAVTASTLDEATTKAYTLAATLPLDAPRMP
jgi:hypothetical protein